MERNGNNRDAGGGKTGCLSSTIEMSVGSDFNSKQSELLEFEMVLSR